ncbi:MAG: tetrahydrofolate dehydrogenase/cyclohydrolase catalytic domain-containing protein, partial [Culicoidibacterales bacterium]
MKIIDGKLHAQAIYKELAAEIEALPQKPTLVIVQVANHQASEAYIRGKITAAKQVGIEARIQNYPETITHDQLLAEIT